MSAASSKTERRWLRWARRGLGVAALGSAILWAVWLLLPKPDLLPPGLTFSRVVTDREGGLLHLSLTPDGKYRLPVRLSEVSPQLIAATLAKEDHRYQEHHGVDLRGVVRAAWGVCSGQRLGGGSTISMQIARMRWGIHSRSVWGKLTQMFRAIQLERHYGKEELLEAYLTLAPYGGNVEGATAAARLWCGKSPAALTDREAAALAVLPQSPTTRRPKAGGNPALSAASSRLLGQMRGWKSNLDACHVLAPPPAPRFAPHLSRRLLSASPEAPKIACTLERRSQQIAEASLASFLARRQDRGLSNGAILLVHAPTREARAYVGSAAFLRDDIHGQVDGVISRRSPGSALKPFIYALALDAGLIHPATLMDDTPRQFGTYNPENSDRVFLGPISAAESLRRSRNLPAVDLLARLPNGGLDSWLRASGVPLTRPPGEYGLSLALGGAEVSMEDLARLYCALATDGVSRPVLFSSASFQAGSGAPTLSAAARELTLDALRADQASVTRGLAWKTGTSHGFRDAWACGVMGEYVIIVWVGHHDAKAMPGMFARETAAPLLFETVTRLGLSAKPRAMAPGLVQVHVCSESGMVAGPDCANRCKSKLIAGVSPTQSCDVHRRVFLNSVGLRVNPGDPSGQPVVREFWPEHRLEQFRRAGMPRANRPAWAPGSAPSDPGKPPRILSPQSGLQYVLQPENQQKRFIPLKAAGEMRRVHWFAGSQYLGSSEGAQPFLWAASSGKWTVQAADDHGRTASVQIQVAMAP